MLLGDMRKDSRKEDPGRQIAPCRANAAWRQGEAVEDPEDVEAQGGAHPLLCLKRFRV